MKNYWTGLFIALIFLTLTACIFSSRSDLQSKGSEYLKIVDKHSQLLKDYGAGKIDEFAFPAEAGSIQGEPMVKTSEFEAALNLSTDPKVKEQGQKFLEGCKLVNEGVRLFDSGVISKSKSTMETGEERVKQGLAKMEESGLLK